MLDVFLLVLIILIGLYILPLIVIKWFGLIVFFKEDDEKEEEPKERYFLYDLKEKKWVETKKDPTGGENE